MIIEKNYMAQNGWYVIISASGGSLYAWIFVIMPRWVVQNLQMILMRFDMDYQSIGVLINKMNMLPNFFQLIQIQNLLAQECMGLNGYPAHFIFVADKLALNYHLICENTWGSILSEPETFLSGSYSFITVWKALQHIVCCLQRNHATTQLHFLWKVLQLNSSPPSAAYMCQWIRPALVQIMACCLFGSKPLSKLMLEYC